MNVTGITRTLLYMWDQYDTNCNVSWTTECVNEDNPTQKQFYSSSMWYYGIPEAIGDNKWSGHGLNTSGLYPSVGRVVYIVAGGNATSGYWGLKKYTCVSATSTTGLWDVVDMRTVRHEEYSNNWKNNEKVYSTNENRYPKDDHVGDKWYIYKGLG